MEEIKQEFIPLPDDETDLIGGEGIRSGSTPADPMPSRMTREYSEFLHRFDDDGPDGRAAFKEPLFDDSDSSPEEPAEASSLKLPAETAADTYDLPADAPDPESDSHIDLNFPPKQSGSAVDEDNPAEEILDSGSFTFSDTD